MTTECRKYPSTPRRIFCFFGMGYIDAGKSIAFSVHGVAVSTVMRVGIINTTGSWAMLARIYDEALFRFWHDVLLYAASGFDPFESGP
jgi:hypothetical protein